MNIATNLTPRKTSGLKMSQKSLTVPDQSLTMREIMTRFTLGQSLNADFSEHLQYMDESDLETATGINIKTLDLSEQHAIKDYWKNKAKANETVRPVSEQSLESIPTKNEE